MESNLETNYYSCYAGVPRQASGWLCCAFDVMGRADINMISNAACKDEFQVFNWSYSQLSFFIFFNKKSTGRYDFPVITVTGKHASLVKMRWGGDGWYDVKCQVYAGPTLR